MNIPGHFKSHLAANWQKYVNIYLFLNFAAYTAWQLKGIKLAGNLNFVEISFAIQNLALCGVILVRSDHKAIDADWRHQAVALAAFFSGLLMLGHQQASWPAAREISAYLTGLANLLGIFTIFNLGRSFGIMIARREVKTYGLYRIVRHPMYATDLLLRAGYLVGHPDVTTALIMLFSVLLYYRRAEFEEKFLSQDEKYRDYLLKVRWRFIPFIV